MAKTPAPQAGAAYRGPANLSGKVAIVTGGTQGLGEAIARLFSERGAAGIVICGRNRERGERVASDISSAGCPTVFVEADLAKVADCRKVVATADERFGRVDVLVNAAALTDRGDIFDTTEQRFNEIFDVNVRGPFFLIQESVRIMRRERIAGSVVNIQSMSAHGGQPFNTAYCASKGALATLTRNVAHSLLKFRIRVNGLNIGWMSTPGEDTIQKKLKSLANLNDPEIRLQMAWSDPSDADFVPLELQRANTRFPFGRMQFRSFMSRIGCSVMIRGHERVVEGLRRVYGDPDAILLSLFSAGGATNEDLPPGSNYREVEPMALRIRHKNGVSRMTPFPIAYERYNDPEHNGFQRLRAGARG